MKNLKRLLIALVVIPVVLVGILVTLVFTLDPNLLKPHITQAAKNSGVNLKFEGDLAWQIIPTLGVRLGKLEATTTDGNPLASIGHAAVGVKLAPLLSRQIEVSAVALEQAKVFYTVDKRGKTNWDAITAGNATDEDTAPAQTTGKAPNIAVDQIHLTQLALSYTDAQTQTEADIEGLNLTITGLALDGTPFDLTLALTAKTNALPTAVNLELQTQAQVNLDAQLAVLEGATLKINAKNAKAELALTSKTQWGEALSSEGTLDLKPLNAKTWLQALSIELPTMKNPGALSQLGVKSSYLWNGQKLSLPDTQITLDDTTLSGNTQVTPGDILLASSHWQGTTINLDDYLPPPVEGEAQQPPPNADAPPTPLPLAPLRAMQVDASVQFESVLINNIPITHPTLKISNAKGLVTLEQLSAQLADGTINSMGTFDARSNTAKADFNFTTKNVNLGQLLKTAADVDAIDGNLFAEAKITTHGKTDADLTDNLLANATVTSEAMQVTPINLEKTYCQAMALLQQQKLPSHDWPKLTRMEPLTVQVQMKGQEVNLENLSAKIAKLTGNAHGQYNLAKGDFNVPFKLSLGDFAGEIEGCLPIPAKWRKRELPIRCKGNLDSIGIKTCLPDTDLLKDMLKEKAKAKIKQEQKRAEKKLKSKAQELLDKNVKEEDKKAVKDTLKGLFKGL